MPFTLITPNGKVYTFFIKSVADVYQSAYGGTVTTPVILSPTKSTA